MEIEIKAKCKNKKIFQTKLQALGAKPLKRSHQIDEYYNHPKKDLVKEPEYIRLRYVPKTNEGVFAYHKNISNGVSEEKEVNIRELGTFKEILKLLGLNLLGAIDKKREEYSFGEYSIVIDEVKDIGTFIEVETEGKQDQIQQKKKACKELLLKLGLQEKDICENLWLCDIATGKTKYCKNNVGG